MSADYFMTTRRLGFGRWTEEMLPEARLLWRDPEVSRYICAAGTFSEEEIWARLQKEIENDRLYGIQYWPIFTMTEEASALTESEDAAPAEEISTEWTAGEEKLSRHEFLEEEDPDNAPGLLVGCCGLRPHIPREETLRSSEGTLSVPEGAHSASGEMVSFSGTGFELGFHLRPQFWHKGYATEAATAVIAHAFDTLGADYLFAGHNPANVRSRTVLERLGFTYIGDEYYAPTGLYHPSYVLKS